MDGCEQYCSSGCNIENSRNFVFSDYVQPQKSAQSSASTFTQLTLDSIFSSTFSKTQNLKSTNMETWEIHSFQKGAPPSHCLMEYFLPHPVSKFQRIATAQTNKNVLYLAACDDLSRSKRFVFIFLTQLPLFAHRSHPDLWGVHLIQIPSGLELSLDRDSTKDIKIEYLQILHFTNWPRKGSVADVPFSHWGQFTYQIDSFISKGNEIPSVNWYGKSTASMVGDSSSTTQMKYLE